MFSLLLILLTIIAVAVIAGVGPLVTKRLSLRVNFVIICSYLAVLIVLSAACLAVPANAFNTVANPEEMSASFNNADIAVGAGVRAGSFDAPKGFLKTVSSFDAPSGPMTVTRPDTLPGTVYIGTKGIDAPDNGSGKIEVYSYTCGYAIFDNTYYTVPVVPPIVTMGIGTLSIEPAKTRAVSLYRFTDSGTVPQFFDTDLTHYGGSACGYLAVVVLLPRGVTCSADGTTPLASLTKPPVFSS